MFLNLLGGPIKKTYKKKSYKKNINKKKSYKKRSNKRKQVPWAGWGSQSPDTRQRTKMMHKCGKKCFLGPKKSFPICTKNTCDINPKGVYAAYVRASQWGKKKNSYKGKTRPTMNQSVYKNVAKKSRKMLKKYGKLR